jgi:hypothetical protein
MNKVYLFLADSAIDKESFNNALSGPSIPFDVTFYSDRSGFISSDDKFYGYLDGILLPLHDDLGLTLSILAAHRDGPLEEKCLKEAIGYYPNQARFVADLLMKELSFGDYSSLPLLSAEFKGVPHELLLTAGTYLRCGLDASLAAQQLFIHRNTFNYRLSSFIDKTGLDIRDYHNALLLELFFQLGSPS